MNRLKEKVYFYIQEPKEIIYFFLHHGIGKLLPDAWYLRIKYKLRTGNKLNLDDPKTFNEKLQWLKLYDRKPEYTQMVDKYEAKKYVADHIGEEYIIPTLGVWERFEDIDFDSLPNQFVLKCTHDSGGVVICRDKSKLDQRAAQRKIEKSLKRNYYFLGREWPYKNVKPRIIAEQYMKDTITADRREGLTDYKFYCFNGMPQIMLVATGRAEKRLCFDFFDMEYNHLSIKQGSPNAKVLPEKPVKFDLMIEFSKKLSAGLPHIRVDFYEVNQKLYFGELTLFDSSGFEAFEPDIWDAKLGEFITLPEKKQSEKMC